MSTPKAVKKLNERVRTGQTAFPASPSVLPSFRSSSCQHQISPLPSGVSIPTQVLRALLTRMDCDEVEGVERAMAAVVGANEGPTVIDERGVWSASCVMKLSSASSSQPVRRAIRGLKQRTGSLETRRTRSGTHVVDRYAYARCRHCQSRVLPGVLCVLHGGDIECGGVEWLR